MKTGRSGALITLHSNFMRKTIFLISMSWLTGCSGVPAVPGISPYKIDVQQGNYVNQEMVATLKPGMQAGERAEPKGHLEPFFLAGGAQAQASRRHSHFPRIASAHGCSTCSSDLAYLRCLGLKLTKLQRHASHLQRFAPSASLSFAQLDTW
jgi:hypothetical protein